MSRLPDPVLAELEADALKETKALAASGKRRTAAKLPVFRLRGPFVPEAELCGISFLFGYRKSKFFSFDPSQEGAVVPDVEIDAGSDQAPYNVDAEPFAEIVDVVAG